MKFKIRNNVFETNSSSCHSLQFQGFSDKKLSDLNCRVEVGEFGWDEATLFGPEDILSYLWTCLSTDAFDMARYPEYKPSYGNYSALAKTYDPEASIARLKSLCPKVEFVPMPITGSGKDAHYEGYVDHQGKANVLPSLLTSLKDPQNFGACVFNASIYTGNDNGDVADGSPCFDESWSGTFEKPTKNIGR